MKKFTFLIIVILAAYNFSRAQILPELDKIKEIKLLESNRDDVRRLFEGYKLETTEYQKYTDEFYTDEAEITISYSEGVCEDAESEDWKVAEWKIIDISIIPKNRIDFKKMNLISSRFGIDVSKLKKEKVSKNSPYIYTYHNKEIGLVITVNTGEIVEIRFIPAKKYYFSMCDKEKAKRLFLTKSLFDPKDKKSRYIISDSQQPANVTNLILSLPEITAECPDVGMKQNKECSNEVKMIAIFTVSVDPEGDVLTYDYKVSGGKIIGEGTKVLWDLSGVKPGTYTITAAVDDGCGFCGESMTKTVIVKECSNCSKN